MTNEGLGGQATENKTAINALSDSKGVELRYDQLVENMPAAVYTCNAQGYITSYNKAAAELWGRKPEIGKDLWCGSWRIFWPDGSPVALEDCPMAIALKTGVAVTNREIIVERPDGVRVNVRPHPSPIFDGSGNLAGAINILLDITENKMAEEKTARLAAIVQSSDDAIISKTLNGIITSWNASAERIFGYSAAEMIGESITRLFPPGREDEEPKILERLRRGERVDHFETQRLSKKGQLIDVSVTISPLRDGQGNIIGASKVARDITEQKRAARLIGEAEERFRMAVEATGLGTWDYDPISGSLDWSPECRKIYNIDADTEIDFDVFKERIYEEDAERTLTAISSAIEPSGTGNYDIQFRIVRFGDDALRWVRSQGKVFFKDREPRRFIGTVLDITEDKIESERLERLVTERTVELNEANIELAKSNKELEQFAYVASHDLQEPLRKIQTFADRLQLKGGPLLNTELNSYIERIVSSSEKMSTLIKDLLNYARADREELNISGVDLNKVLHSVKDDLYVMIDSKHAEIESDTLPVIHGNATQLNQLFHNLLSNSLKFSDGNKKPVVNITSRRMAGEEVRAAGLNERIPHYELKFADNGIGFSAEYTERIFTIFQRLNNRQEYPGTGIGLALCRKIVDNHNGLITAESKPKAGATFTVVLPEIHR
jgi:PAS domain S-box-containing protein